MWLAFFLVCFAGIGFMFFCILRRQDAMMKALAEERARVDAVLHRLEVGESGSSPVPSSVPAADSVQSAPESVSVCAAPLEHLDFGPAPAERKQGAKSVFSGRDGVRKSGGARSESDDGLELKF